MVDNLSLHMGDSKTLNDCRTEEVQATDLCFTFNYGDFEEDEEDDED